MKRETGERVVMMMREKGEGEKSEKSEGLGERGVVEREGWRMQGGGRSAIRSKESELARAMSGERDGRRRAGKKVASARAPPRNRRDGSPKKFQFTRQGRDGSLIRFLTRGASSTGIRPFEVKVN